MNAASVISPSWKEQQRALSRRARMVSLHSPEQRAEVRKLLRYRGGGTYRVMADGSLQRVS